MKQETLTELEPSKDLGILVGMLLTDGFVSQHENSWEIGFVNKSSELHKIFEEKMKNLFGELHFIKTSNSVDKEVKMTRVSSKAIGNTLTKFSPSFRTLRLDDGTFPNVKIPEFVFSLPEDEIKDILKVMFSADGCVTFTVSRRRKNIHWRKQERWEIKGEVNIGCKHPTIKEQLIALLQKFGFKPRKNKDKVILGKMKDIIKFKNEIGFLEGVKIGKNSKLWVGFDKTQILDLVIKTFDLKKRDLQEFKTREDIISFLKSFMAPVAVAS